MIVVQGTNNVDTMQRMYAAVARSPEVEVRGSKTRNTSNMAVILDPRFSCITSFAARNLNLDYCKREWLWYLGANRYDDSIEAYAKMWAKLKQKDGGYNSNYGQYIFGEREEGRITQYEYVLETLAADRFSRRASIVLLDQNLLYAENTDVVCTYAINFTIEGECLNMTVMMRSNDVIFGFTNDAFCFWQLYLFVFARLQVVYPWLKSGTYTHFTNSMHVYDRHYTMIKELVADRTMRGYNEIKMPLPSAQEAHDLVTSRGREASGEYVDWLTA